MAIFKSDGTSFQKVDKVFNRRTNDIARIQKVWVHNGTKYILVKGRMLEVIWETDLSTYGGASWDNSNRLPYNNVISHPYITNSGDLIGVVNAVIKNNSSDYYSGSRKALMKITSSGEISSFSPYTSWTSWRSVAGYTYTAHPIGWVKRGDYYVTFSDMGIFDMFNASGGHISHCEIVNWHTDGTCKNYGMNSISRGDFDIIFACLEETTNVLYFLVTDQNDSGSDTSSYMSSVWRMGIPNTSFATTPYRHYAGVRQARTYSTSNSILIDSETHKGIATFCNRKNSAEHSLVVFDASAATYTTKSDVSALCSLTMPSTEIEYPVATKNGYVYTYFHNGNYYNECIRKRSLTDLSSIWTVSITPDELNCGYIHQPLVPYDDGGFLLPNGDVIYEDGYVLRSNKIYKPNKYDWDAKVKSYTFDEDLGIGYMVQYSGTSENICSVLKFKEVLK